VNFISLASSSSGNAYIIYNNKNELILLDAGISHRRIKNKLKTLSLDVNDIKYVLLTHCHSDHISGLSTLIKRVNPLIVTHKINARFMEQYNGDMLLFDYNDNFLLDSFNINALAASHDVPTVSFVIKDNDSGKSLGFVSDTGIISRYTFEAISSVNFLALESNYSVTHLDYAPYPEHVKLRIASNRGHLSNDQALTIMKELPRRLKEFLLIHISRNSNSPQTVTNEVLDHYIKVNNSSNCYLSPYDDCSLEFII